MEEKVWGFYSKYNAILHFSNASIELEIDSIILCPSVTQSTEPW